MCGTSLRASVAVDLRLSAPSESAHGVRHAALKHLELALAGLKGEQPSTWYTKALAETRAAEKNLRDRISGRHKTQRDADEEERRRKEAERQQQNALPGPTTNPSTGKHPGGIQLAGNPYITRLLPEY